MTTNRVFKTPVQAYDLATGELVSADRYLSGQPMEADYWQNSMLKAQRAGRRLAHSNEWSGAQRYHQKRNQEFEARFADTGAWTGTILDFNDETLKEGITLNEDGTIASAKTILGRKDKIVLPSSSAYVKDLDDIHMPLIAYLHGVKDPKRELLDYAYIWITPSGIRLVVRGHWPFDLRGDRRVGVSANCGPANGRFAAWTISEEAPTDAITPEEYGLRERAVAEKEAELRVRNEAELEPLKRKLDTSVVLVE